jgi:hypothetical protein
MDEATPDVLFTSHVTDARQRLRRRNGRPAIRDVNYVCRNSLQIKRLHICILFRQTLASCPGADFSAGERKFSTNLSTAFVDIELAI